MELTRNFSLQELIKSDTAIRLDINLSIIFVTIIFKG